MNRLLQITISLLAFLSLMSCNSNDTLNHHTDTILIDPIYLSNAKSSVEANESQSKYAFEQLIKDADKAMQEGPFSVTDKKKLAPSGDNHDYASYSRYWWPDPEKRDGLPYVRRDGETNPGSQSLKESDRPRIGIFGNNTETLGLAYYFTGEPKYASKAAELLRYWFIDEATRMNPNLNHAQIRPGHNDGSRSGVLDGRILIKALDASLLISGSAQLSEQEYIQLKVWAEDYLEWLTTDKLALHEGESENNHGSYYDVQVLYFALFCDNHEAAKKIANRFLENRVYSQILTDGSMPLELARTRSLFYSTYNLQAMFLFAHLAEKLEIDIWEADKEHSRLRSGLDYIVPYADPKTKWPVPTVGNFDEMNFLPLLIQAERIYKDRDYMNMAEELPSDRRILDRSILALPLMQ
jgi:hypothetical protein